MKKTILVVLITVMISAICFGREVEPEGIFSVDGTLWVMCAAGFSCEIADDYRNCDKELGFYQGKVYGDFWELNPSYYDLGVVSIAYEYLNRINSFLTIIQPGMGFGVVAWIEWGNPSCARCAPPYCFTARGILYKINDNWTPPEIE